MTSRKKRGQPKTADSTCIVVRSISTNIIHVLTSSRSFERVENNFPIVLYVGIPAASTCNFHYFEMKKRDDLRFTSVYEVEITRWKTIIEKEKGITGIYYVRIRTC